MKAWRSFLFICAVGFTATSALAQQTTTPITPLASDATIPAVTIGQRVTGETMLMYAYKLAKQEPPYEKWAPKASTVSHAPATERDSVARTEMMREKVAFDTLDMTVPVIIQARLGIDKYSTLTETMGIEEFSDHTYFRFSSYGENVALIPKDITKFSRLNIPKMKMESFLTATNGNRDLLAEILIRPKIADMQHPFVADGVNYYLVMGDIVELRMWGSGAKGPELLWFYRSPEFKPQDRSDLLNLKGGLTP